MWTPATRRQHSREGLRYASDLTDDEWRIVEPLLPGAPGRGRRRAWPLREIANAIFYMLRAGCTWRLLPDNFPPWRTVYRWFVRLRDGGVSISAAVTSVVPKVMMMPASLSPVSALVGEPAASISAAARRAWRIISGTSARR